MFVCVCVFSDGVSCGLEGELALFSPTWIESACNWDGWARVPFLFPFYFSRKRRRGGEKKYVYLKLERFGPICKSCVFIADGENRGGKIRRVLSKLVRVYVCFNPCLDWVEWFSRVSMAWRWVEFFFLPFKKDEWQWKEKKKSTRDGNLWLQLWGVICGGDVTPVLRKQFTLPWEARGDFQKCVSWSKLRVCAFRPWGLQNEDQSMYWYWSSHWAISCEREQPLRLDIKRKLYQRTDRVKCVDLHPTEPWMLTALYSGHVMIWNTLTSVGPRLLAFFRIYLLLYYLSLSLSLFVYSENEFASICVMLVSLNWKIRVDQWRS